MERPEGSFKQREGAALLCMGVTAAIQSILVVSVLYFTGGRAAPEAEATPTLRSGIHR